MSEELGLTIETKSIGGNQVRSDFEKTKSVVVATEQAIVDAIAKRNGYVLQSYKSLETDLEKLRWLEAKDNAAAIRRREEAEDRSLQLAQARLEKRRRMAEEANNIALAKMEAKGTPQDAHVNAFKNQQQLEKEYLAAYDKMLADKAALTKTRNAQIKADNDKLALAKKQAVQKEYSEGKAVLDALAAEEKKTTAIRIAEVKKIERERAKEAAQAQQAQNRGIRVGVGAISGQGFSVGGIASVNPYAAAGLAAAYAVKNVATDLVAEATVWEKFKVALTDIEGSAVKAAQATDDLYELAKRPGIGLKEAEQTYIQFRALNMEGAKAQKVIAAVSNAVALSGGGATEFQRVNYQITQMLSKGKVLEEDLRIMRNSLPRLTVAMRDAFGTTTAEGIRKAGVNAEEFLSKIVTQFEKLPKASQTLESATENATTAISRFKASLVPDQSVKEGLEIFTSVTERITNLNNKLTETAGNSFWAKWTALSTPTGMAILLGKAGVEGLAENSLRQGAKNAAGKAVATAKDKYSFSADDIGNMYRPENTSFTQGGGSLAAYNEDLLRKAQEKAKLEKEIANSTKEINLENEKLRIQLKDITDYEKQRQTIIAEYKYKINEAKTEEAKAALKTQERLQLDVLLNNKKKEELETQKKITEELEKQIQAEQRYADDAFANATGISYAAYKIANPSGVDSEFDQTKSRTKTMRDADDKRIQEQADAWQKSVDAGKDLSMKYAPEFDKLQMEYEKQRQAVVDATFRTGEERNRVMKALNDQYLRDQAEMLTKSATAVTSAGQSLFGDIAGAMKMRSDYEYNTQKTDIEKRLSLNGLEGDARVAQQRRRDEALEALDEKRQKDMQGSYLTMFMIAKGFALAESAIKLNLAIANAAASGPFPANLAAMASVAAAVGSVVSNIAEINYAGAYDKGGFIPAGQVGLVGEVGPEFVSGPARVTSRADTAAMLGGKPNVNVFNYGNSNIEVKQSDNGKDIDIIVSEISKQVEANLTTGIRSGRGEHANALKETFGLTRQGW